MVLPNICLFPIVRLVIVIDSILWLILLIPSVVNMTIPWTHSQPYQPQDGDTGGNNEEHSATDNGGAT